MGGERRRAPRWGRTGLIGRIPVGTAGSGVEKCRGARNGAPGCNRFRRRHVRVMKGVSMPQRIPTRIAHSVPGASALVVVLFGVAALSACSGGSHSAAPTTRAGSTVTTRTHAPPSSVPVTAPVTTSTTLAPSNPTAGVYAYDGVGQFSPAVAGVPTRVYVPNSDANTVDVIDPNTYTVIDHYPVGVLPNHVVPSWDLKTLYVNNTKGNSLTPIDPMTGKPGAPIPVTDPYNLYFTPDGSRAIVVAERFQRLDFRDPHTWALIGSVDVGHKGPNHLDFSPDGKTLLVACEFSGWVVRVDVASMKVTGELNVGEQPIDTRISPDGSVYFVANQGRNGVSVIDPVAMKELQFIPTGRGAHGEYPNRDGTKLYVSNRGEGTISVIDFATRTVVAKWNIGGSPDMGGVSADGKQLWLSGRYNGVVYVVDTTTGALLHTIEVGRGPHGLAFFPQPGRYSLGHTGNYR